MTIPVDQRAETYKPGVLLLAGRGLTFSIKAQQGYMGQSRVPIFIQYKHMDAGRPELYTMAMEVVLQVSVASSSECFRRSPCQTPN